MTGPAVDQIVVVTGASSAIGDFLLPRLMATGRQVVALSRKTRATRVENTQLAWREADLAAILPADLRAQSLVHLAPLWLLPDRLSDFAERGVTRIVALGSTSVYTKSMSPDRSESAVADNLSKAEIALAEKCWQLKITWTLLRPTLIYGAGRDANVSAIAAFIRRFGFFPVAGAALGLRAPVHADDVAQACVAALAADAARNRAYTLSGGEILTYRDMVMRIFTATGSKPRVVATPLWLMETLASAAALAGFRGINAELMRRMNRDQAFDHADAARDLAYAPRGFMPKI